MKPEWIMGPALLEKGIGWKPPYDIDPDPELRVFGMVPMRAAVVG